MTGRCGRCGRVGQAMKADPDYAFRCRSWDACQKRLLATRNAENPREGDRRFRANRTPQRPVWAEEDEAALQRTVEFIHVELGMKLEAWQIDYMRRLLWR